MLPFGRELGIGSKSQPRPPFFAARCDGVKLIALTLDERAVLLAVLEDSPPELAELRGVLLADHEWRRTDWLN